MIQQLKSPKRTLLAVLVTLSMMVAACTAGTDSTDTSTSSDQTSGTQSGDSDAPDDVGAEFNIDLAGWDPAHLTPANTWAAEIWMLFDPPLRVHYETGEIIPAAAESVVSDDQVTWTVTLHDRTFHNGERVTAQSFVDTWNAAATPANAYVQNSAFTNIAGYDDMNPAEGEPTATELAGLEVIDDLTFTITLEEPFGLFPYVLTNWAFSPLPQAALDDPEQYDSAAVGNGQFKLVGAYETNTPLVLERWEEYEGTPGIADTLTFHPYSDMGTAYNDLLAGNIDAVYPIPGDRVEGAADQLDGRAKASTIPNLNFLAFPADDQRFSDVRVRQALSLAIDRDLLSSTILSKSGEAASSLAPAATVGATADACDMCHYDPELAAELLEQAGGWKGPLVLWGPQFDVNDQLLQAMANQIRTNLGIEDISFNVVSFAELAEGTANGTIDGPYLQYYGTFYPHIADFLLALATPNGRANAWGYSSDEVSQLISKAARLDSAESLSVYQQAESAMWEDMPILPIYYGQFIGVWSDDLADLPLGLNGWGPLGSIPPS